MIRPDEHKFKTQEVRLPAYRHLIYLEDGHQLYVTYLPLAKVTHEAFKAEVERMVIKC